jgi:hypothetical protein
VIQFSRSKLGEFRKCIHTMTDSQLVGIGRICRSLSQNSFTNQFAECKQEWNVRHPRTAKTGVSDRWVVRCGTFQTAQNSCVRSVSPPSTRRAVCQSCSTTLRSEVLIWILPLYRMKPNFLNLFMNIFTRERVVPTISASISCDIFGSTVCGLSAEP